MRPLRILGYARVSSVEQARGSSLQDQQNVIAGYAKKLGVKVSQFFVEAESGIREKEERREQMRALLADVRAGDLVLCAKLDRWSRDAEFSFSSVRRILEAGARFYSIDEACDPSTPEGDTALSFRIAFAREEHKRIKSRMVGTRKLLRDAGYYVEGLPPYGYRRAHPKGYKGAEKNILRLEPSEAAKVKKAFALSIEGRSIAETAALLDLHRDRVAHMLETRTYVGEMKNSRGEWVPGRHPAIVNADTFERARVASAGRRLGPPVGEVDAETATWILRDVATCGHCGARMSSAYAGPRGSRLRRFYYRCYRRCVPRYVPVDVAEEMAGPLILARLEELREELAREPRRVVIPFPIDTGERRLKLSRKRARYQEMFAEGMMSGNELRAALAKVDEDLAKLEAIDRKNRRASPLSDPKTRRATLREVTAIKSAWKKATPQDRRELVGLLIHTAAIQALPAPPKPKAPPRKPGEGFGKGRQPPPRTPKSAVRIDVAWRTAEELADRAG